MRDHLGRGRAVTANGAEVLAARYRDEDYPEFIAIEKFLDDLYALEARQPSGPSRKTRIRLFKTADDVEDYEYERQHEEAT